MILNEREKNHIKIRFTYSAIEECVISLHVMTSPEHHTSSRDWAKHKYSRLSDGLKKEIDFIGKNYADWLFVADIAAHISQKSYLDEMNFEKAVDEMGKMDDVQFAYLFLGFPAFGYDINIIRKWIENPDSVSSDDLGVQSNFLSVDNVKDFISDIALMKRRVTETLLNYWNECFREEWEAIRYYFDSIIKKEELICQRLDFIDYINQIHADLTADENYIVFHKNPDYSVALKDIDNIIISLSVFSAPHLMGNVVGKTLTATLNLNFHSVKIQEKVPENISKVIAAASDNTRLKIMKMLWNSESTTKEISEVLELSPSTVSIHLKILKEADLVETNKIKKYVYYSLKKRDLVTLKDNLIKYFEY